jgi:tetratricopeptide (TPR) repeat protein
MFWPVNLSIFYPHPGRSLHFSNAVLPALLLIVITVLVIKFARTRGYLFVGWFWYICTLVPVIGLVQVGDQAMADRYTYIPLIGLFIIIAWGLPELLAGYIFRKKVLAIAATIALLTMAGATYSQLRYWQNGVTILERAVEVNPNDRFSHANLGATYLLKNDLDIAIVHFSKALQIDPCNGAIQSNIGVAFLRKGKIDSAVSHFEKAVEIDPCNTTARLNLAIALAKQGKMQLAIEQCDEVLRIEPGWTEAIELRRGLVSQRQRPR